MGWHVYRVDESLHFASNDHANLYFAVEAVLDVWLSPDAGMVKDGAATMTDAFLETLNGLDTRWDHSIRILTQNMRGSDDPDGNSVQDRSVRFVQMMEEYAPDLVGTQEYSYNWQVWLGRYEKKMGGTAEDRIYGQVGCNNNGPGTKRGGMNAIWYRLDRFELLDSGTFWLSHTPEVPSVIGTRMDLRICTWAKLKDLRTGAIFVFANTHLDHADMELRYMQAEILLEQLRGIVGDLPLYLTGDFNTGWRSSVHDLVTSVLQNSHKTAWVDVSENWGTYHAYEQYGSEIDFIFHDAHSEAVRYDIVTKQYDGYISDHYGVIVDFVPVTNG
jgi:endonuclease/exonuclease/phosphatase family metal-dependent hydrolase